MKRILGVNFTANRLSASLIDSRLGIVKPVKTENIPLPNNNEERDLLILETLKSWKKEYSPDGVVIGLPLQNFLYQIIEMPLMSRDDLKKALLFELEKYLPLPVDEYVFDFISYPFEKNKLKALVLSVKKDSISGICRIVKESGLDIFSIKCSTIDTINSFLDVAGKKNIKGLFINITDDACEIVGLENSRPVFFKHISKNIDSTKEIERLLGMHPGEIYFNGNAELSTADKFKGIKYQLSSSNALAYFEVKKPSLNFDFLLTDYVKKTVDYYPFVLGGLSAAAVIIFLMTGIVAYLKDLYNVKTIESKIDSIKNKASGIIDLHKKHDLMQNDIEVLSDFHGRSNKAIRAISVLSEIISNDIWLVNFSVDDIGKIEMEGFAVKTSALSVAIEKSKAFKNVTFTSAIVAKDGKEHFDIKMEAEGLEKK